MGSEEKEALRIFTDKGDPSRELLMLLDDKSITNRYGTLEEYLVDAKIQYAPKALQKLIRDTDASIAEQVSYYAHLMYHHMELTGEWGEPGEQQVKIAFCRNLLEVSPTRTLTQGDALNFMAKVDETLQQLGIKGLSAEEVAVKMRNFSFKVFGKQYEGFRSQQVHNIAEFVGSKRFLHGGQYGAQQEYIIGEGKKTSKQGYDIVYLNKELVRTPNNVMSMAAIIGHRNIYIRMESLRTIFAQKWLQIFDYTDYEREQIEADTAWNIAEGIKQRVLDLYGVKTREDLEKIEKAFLKDMAETILYHELGHGIIQHNILPLELGAIGEGTKLYGENIYTSILEFLADFAPAKDDIVGPLHNMIRIHKTDPERAKRMYYLYMSDTWFFNTKDEYMYTYSDMMALILLRYIKEDGDIDFEALDADLQFREDRGKQEKLTLFERIYELYTWDAQEIKTIIEHASYTIPAGEMDYKKTRALLIQLFMENDGYVHEDTYEFLVPFWTNMIGYVRQISDSAEKLESYVKNQERKNLMKMMVLSCGRKKAESYQFDHRQYVFDRMIELGIKKK